MHFLAFVLPLLSSIPIMLAATVGQIPLTAKPTEETPTTTPASSPSLPTISFTTTIKLPDLNLHINANQLDDPELEQILSSALPAEMLTLLVSATARSVSPADESTTTVASTAGQLEMALPTSTSLAMRGGAWRGIAVATTTEEMKDEETKMAGLGGDEL